MYVCMYVCIYIYMYIHIYICIAGRDLEADGPVAHQVEEDVRALGCRPRRAVGLKAVSYIPSLSVWCIRSAARCTGKEKTTSNHSEEHNATI